MSFFKHLGSYRLIYFWLPLMVALVVFAFKVVPLLDHRAPVDDAGALAGWAQSAVAFALVLAFADVAKPHLFDDIDTNALVKQAMEAYQAHKSEYSPWGLAAMFAFVAFRVLLDSAETLGLILLGFCVFGIWK